MVDLAIITIYEGKINEEGYSNDCILDLEKVGKKMKLVY